MYIIIYNYSRLGRELANPRPGFLWNPILKGIVGQLLGQLYNIIAGNPSEQARESNPRLPHVGFEPASPEDAGQNKTTLRVANSDTVHSVLCT